MVEINLIYPYEKTPFLQRPFSLPLLDKYQNQYLTLYLIVITRPPQNYKKTTTIK